jgi:photosystem II stability/assembly factor-like uncharacterized protein
MNRQSCFILLLLVLTSFSASQSKKNSKPPQAAQQASAPQAARIDENLFGAMRWRQVGPFRGGRVLAVTGVPGEPNVFYFGAASGGIWRSTDAGANWEPLFDKESIASIGSIDVASSDHNIIYAGSGEACIRGNITYGNGVYKSVDGGKSWKNIGLKDTRHIGAVIVDPKHPNIVFVAALGHAYGPNEERGVFRTTDGGATWQKVLFKDNKTGAIDVVFDPKNSNTLFSSLWQVYRTPWSLDSGGPGSGLYKSTDGGTSWKRLEAHGLPAGIMGRIGVSVSGADSNRVYALIESKEGGLYRSDDGGENWTKINDDGRLRQRAWYFTHIFADPKSADTVYILNTGMLRSTDGGRSFNLLNAPHGDHHGLWIDPGNPQRLINGNDGGATVSTDGGKTWTTQYNQPTAQFYHVITDNRWPYFIYGAQQDNSTIAIKSYDDDGVIGRQDWFPVGGGESGYIAPYPPDPNIVYAGAEGLISRFRQWSGKPAAPLQLDLTFIHLCARSRHALYRERDAVQIHQWRPELDGHQPRPHAQRQVQAKALGRFNHPGHHQRGILRHHLRRGRITLEKRPAVGGYRRRPGARDYQWRPELEQRLPERNARMEHDQHY